MNTKKQHWLLIILFCGFLAAMSAAYLFLPKQAFSQLEKRYLADTPELTWESLSSGDFSEAVDTYMADHIPGRSFFVGLNAYYDLLTGRQGSKDILLTRNGRLVEAPAQPNTAAIEKNMAVINGFAENQSIPVDLMVVPSAGWASEDQIRGLHPAYQDKDIIDSIYSMSSPEIRTVDILSVFEDSGHPENFYYRTDHHWNSLGAHTAYQTYMESLGQVYRPTEEYQVETIEEFYGSAYSRSALWLIPGEPLELWQGSDSIQVTHEESTEVHSGIFFRERLAEPDKYTVFLDGNHALVRLENPDAISGEKLLVIRDSFSNCLGGFLADSFETVVLADLRYYRQPLSQLIAEEGFDRILICYSLGNFLTDTNMVWLR